MNRVMLITLYGESNFGNRLQNYALNKTIQKMEFAVDNLLVRKPVNKRSVKRKVKIIVKQILTATGIKNYKASLAKTKRTDKFIIFRDKYLHNIVYFSRYFIEKRNWHDYKFIITGSDQVWHNWGNIKNELAYYYLEFVEPEKRISYAPSFGFTEFPSKDIEEHRKGLAEMKALSCREQEGCKLINELTGRVAQKVLDPTLLLTREEWQAIEKKAEFTVPENYLLLLFLGKITDEYQREIDRIRDKDRLNIINLNDPNDPIHYAISPDEFIWLIHHATVVCTDSFHASVFSVIFEKKLRVFQRSGVRAVEDMFGRLYDLLEPLGLMNVVYGYGDGTKLSTALSKEATEYLEREKVSSLDYLQNALNSGKKEEK